MNSSGQLGSGLEGCSPDVGTRMVCLSPPQTEGEASPESGGWLPIWGLLVFGPGSIKCVYGIHFCVSPKRVCVCLFVYVYMSPSPSLLEHLRLPRVWGPISPWHIPCQWLLPPSAGALVLLGIWVWMLGSVLACSWWLLGGTWAPWICLLLVGVGVSLGLGLGLLRCSQWSLWACRCSHLGRLHCGCWVTPPQGSPLLFSEWELRLSLWWSTWGSHALEGLYISGAQVYCFRSWGMGLSSWHPLLNIKWRNFMNTSTLTQTTLLAKVNLSTIFCWTEQGKNEHNSWMSCHSNTPIDFFFFECVFSSITPMQRHQHLTLAGILTTVICWHNLSFADSWKRGGGDEWEERQCQLPEWRTSYHSRSGLSVCV